ncbi:LytTR family DNA-binding domain-containing protein [uncultured Lacinutrix sp.]|uniref:LytR/AlgR family response regulator transcription factor n=1 Tax=uncultured Lacinutrix sp. TaxID=574032 RepID=UPI00262786AB|nr:response regulator transcription factor [uncultured Lacinutrix sp.]
MTVYVVEDEVFQLEDILITLETLEYDVIGTSDDPFEAQEQIGELQPEVVLMDIHLNGKQAGVALAKRLVESHNIPIIFTSSEKGKDVIIEAAEVSPIAYLTKPINEKDLRAALLIAESKTSNVQDFEVTSSVDELFIKNGNKLIKVLISSILFAHTDTKNYCTIVTDEGKKYSVRNSILGLHKLLNSEMFIQTHRSYIINWKKVDSLYESDQTIDIKGYTVPVGRTFKAQLYKKINIV